MNMTTVATKYEELFMREGIKTSVICRGESEVLIFAEDPLDVCDFMLQFGRMFSRNENGWLVYDMR